MEVVGDDIATQADQVLRNLDCILAAGGVSRDQVLMMQVFLADIEHDLSGFNVVYSRFYSAQAPPRFAIGAQLAWSKLLVEVHAIAAKM